MEQPNLGRCCGCGNQGDDVRNIVALPYKATEAGSGWGCFTCDLPSEGAVAVLCDTCLEFDNIQSVVVGYAEDNKRIPYEEFKRTAQPHEHDYSKHGELYDAN